MRLPIWLARILRRPAPQQTPAANSGGTAQPAPGSSRLYVTPQPTGASSKGVKKRLSDLESLTKYVLFVTIATMVGVLVTLAGVVSDQWRFNQELYKEKADKAMSEANTAEQKAVDLKNKIDQLSKQLEAAQEKQAK